MCWTGRLATWPQYCSLATEIFLVIVFPLRVILAWIRAGGFLGRRANLISDEYQMLHTTEGGAVGLGQCGYFHTVEDNGSKN